MESPRNKQIGGTHYKDFEIQPIDFIVRNNLDWFTGNAIKYLLRHKLKHGKEDLMKAIHYIELAVDYYYRDTPEFQVEPCEQPSPKTPIPNGIMGKSNGYQSFCKKLTELMIEQQNKHLNNTSEIVTKSDS